MTDPTIFGAWSRRRFGKALAAGGAAVLAPTLARGQRAPDVELQLAASTDVERLFPGAPTPILRFTGKLLSGRQDALIPGTGYLGPTLDLRRGERVRIHFDNRLPEPSIIHWHGMLVPEAADGHPRFAVPRGGRYTYEFTVRNPAGTYVYHPHPHGRTGFQVYYGLAGLLIVREPLETEAGLPDAAHDLPLVLQDRRVASDNSFLYGGAMADAMNGMLGRTVFVNGRTNAAFRVRPRGYRLRLVNASNARIYKLAWSDGSPMNVIGADGGLFSAAEGVQQRSFITLAPLQRIEILEDFSRRKYRAEIELRSLAFSAASGMMGGMMGGGGQGEALSIARFVIGGEARERAGPLRLPPRERPSLDGSLERYTELGFMGGRGFLNGRSFGIAEVADEERIPVGRPVVWTFTNPAMGMMSMPHPMHIHGVQFRIAERSGGRSDLAAGIVDAGLHDVALLQPGEQVRVAFTATDPGLYLYHCHNLEHEDGGMMRNVLFERA